MIRHAGCLVVSNLGEEKADRAHNDPCEPPPQPSPCASRHNLTMHLSCDEAASWRPLGSVYQGPAAYSSLASLPWRADAVGAATTPQKAHPVLSPDRLFLPYRQAMLVVATVLTAAGCGTGVLFESGPAVAANASMEQWELAPYAELTFATVPLPLATVDATIKRAEPQE